MLTSTLTLTRAARDLMRDSQSVHRTLMHACRGQRPLWGAPDMSTLVIQHDTPVDWTASMPGIIRQAVTIPTTTPITGAPIQWAVIANPTAAIMQPGAKRGKRRALPPEKWNIWVERKLAAGINIHSIDGCALPTARGTKQTMRTQHRRVLFTGTGTVSNRADLTALQYDGVGPGKAYGCGLLIVTEAVAA